MKLISLSQLNLLAVAPVTMILALATGCGRQTKADSPTQKPKVEGQVDANSAQLIEIQDDNQGVEEILDESIQNLELVDEVSGTDSNTDAEATLSLANEATEVQATLKTDPATQPAAETPSSSTAQSSGQGNAIMRFQRGFFAGEKIRAERAVGAVHARECKEDPSTGIAIVEIFRGRLRGQGIALPGFSNGSLRAVSEYVKRTWSKTGSQIECSENGRYALIDWMNIEGLKLDVEFKRGIAGAAGYKAPFAEADGALKAGFLAEGKRSLAFSQSQSETELLRSVSVLSEVTRSFKTKNQEGQVADMKLVVKTADGAPMKFESVSDAKTLELKSRTIRSGKLLAERKNGSKIETTFADVAYVRKDNCLRPQSGTVSGTITSKEGKVKTFSAVYTLENVKLSLPSGEVKTVAHSCTAQQ